MSPRNPYLTASIPEVPKPAKQAQGGGSNDSYAALEARIAELNEQLVKQNRDNLDAEYNIDEENLSESLLNKINSLEARVKALEDQINT